MDAGLHGPDHSNTPSSDGSVTSLNKLVSEQEQRLQQMGAADPFGVFAPHGLIEDFCDSPPDIASNQPAVAPSISTSAPMTTQYSVPQPTGPPEGRAVHQEQLPQGFPQEGARGPMVVPTTQASVAQPAAGATVTVVQPGAMTGPEAWQAMQGQISTAGTVVSAARDAYARQQQLQDSNSFNDLQQEQLQQQRSHEAWQAMQGHVATAGTVAAAAQEAYERQQQVLPQAQVTVQHGPSANSSVETESFPVFAASTQPDEPAIVTEAAPTTEAAPATHNIVPEETDPSGNGNLGSTDIAE